MKKSVYPFFEPYKCEGKSKTIPNQSFTVSEILAKFAGGSLISDELMRSDELGDVDEDIDDDFDVPRQEPGEFDRNEACRYVGTIEDEIRKEELARKSLDNYVPDDTTEKKSEKSEEKVVDVKESE